jgi:hypothetical protein
MTYCYLYCDKLLIVLSTFTFSLGAQTLPFHFHFLIAMLGGVTLWYLQKFLQYIRYIIVEFTPSIILIYAPLSSISGIVLTGIVFSIHIYVYTVFALYSFSYTLSPHLSPPPLVPTPARQNLLFPSVLQFCKRKIKWHFGLFKIAIQKINFFQLTIKIVFVRHVQQILSLL